MKTQTEGTDQEKPNGYLLWLKLKASLAWLKRVVSAMIIAGSLYIGAVQPVPVRAGDYTAGDYATLVTAINNANASPEDDTITLTGDITLTGNLPLIKSNLLLNGTGHFVSGNDQYRVFFVGGGIEQAAPTVTFKDMTIQHGRAQGGHGSGGGAGLGGGMFVFAGNVTVENVTFTQNTAQGGSRANVGGGGMGGTGSGDYGGGGGLWAGADGGTTGSPGGSAGNYGGGGGGNCCGDSGGPGGGVGGGSGHIQAGGGGGLNGGNASHVVGGGGGFGGGGGGGVNVGGNGGFGGGGGWGYYSSGNGGFGGGGGGCKGSGRSGGLGGFGGGGGAGLTGGGNGAAGFGGGSDGGGAGLGGGLFIRTGVLTMTTVAFNDNTAAGGNANGQGLGGGLFVLHTLTNANGNNQGMPTELPSISAASCGVTFSGNAAANDAGISTDNDDVFGNLGGAAGSCASELNLSKSVTPDTNVAYHGLVTYTITLANSGAMSDTNVILTDTLPAQVSFGAWREQPGGVVRNGNAITWTGALTSHTAITLTFTAQHTGSYSNIITNTARVSGTTQTGQAQAAFSVAPNHAPVLAAIGAQTGDEGALLSFTAIATDTDVPAQPLTFTLDAGSVGAITTGGDFTWTPAEAEGPGVYTATIRVSDGALTDSETIQITVAEVNQAPVLGALGNQTVDEGALLSLPATATDGDLPAQPITFTLDAGSVGSITAGGAYSWQTTDAHGPGVYTATVRVSDGELDDFETFTITVNEINPPPISVTLPIAGPGTYPFGAFCGGVTFTDTQGVTAITATFAYTYPSVNHNGLPRQYTLAANGTGFQAAVTFCYEDHDLLVAGIAAPETDLHAYRYIHWDEPWQAYSEVDPDANTVTAYGITTFGIFGLGVEADQPTALKAQTLSARTRGLLPLAGLVALGGVILLRRRRRAG